MDIRPEEKRDFPLESYGYNLTRLAREWTFQPAHVYDAWVERIFDILLRKEKNWRYYNPVLIDGDETRRWHVVMEVLRRLITGDVPAPLSTLQIIAPNFIVICGVLPAIEQSGIMLEGEARLAQLLSWPSSDTWEESHVVRPRFEAFFSAVSQVENQVLLLNDFHRLIGGEPGSYEINMLNILIPALARRQTHLLGISTLEPFRQYIERNAAIGCRVQPVVLYRKFTKF